MATDKTKEYVNGVKTILKDQIGNIANQVLTLHFDLKQKLEIANRPELAMTQADCDALGTLYGEKEAVDFVAALNELDKLLDTIRPAMLAVRSY